MVTLFTSSFEDLCLPNTSSGQTADFLVHHGYDDGTGADHNDPSFLIIQKLGLYDNLFAIVFPSLVGGFGIFLCKQFIEDIPDSMVEAASIDGAGNMRIFFMVILPLIKPTLSALAIFTFLGKWNDYLNPLLYLSDISRMTMPLALSFFTSQRTSDLGGVMAAATLVILPVTIVFLCFQKQFVRGISITGMK